jgi:hypothetical protein
MLPQIWKFTKSDPSFRARMWTSTHIHTFECGLLVAKFSSAQKIYIIIPLSPYNSAQSSKMVLLNGPSLSNFVDRGLGEWEWLGPGSTNFFFNILIPLMVLQNGTFEWHFVTHSRSLCVTRPKTYLLWFWLPPSFPIRSITLPFSLPFLSATLSLPPAWNPALSRNSEVTSRGTSQWPSATGTH